MGKNVFILGAGFSSPTGAPLIYNFLPSAKRISEDHIEELRVSGYLEDFERVFTYKDNLKRVNATFKEDFDDIEKLYSYSDFECRYIDDSPEKLAVRKSLIFMIVKTLDMLAIKKPASSIFSSKLLEEYKRLNDPIPKNLNIYHIFALFLSGKYNCKPCNSSVVTFNYDVILDNACVDQQICPYYCLPDEKESLPSLKIFKLHGSANWMTCSNPLCENDGKLVSVKGYGKFLDEYKNGACSKCDQKQLMPLIVPPSWDKTQFREILGNIWKEAGKEIREAKRIFIIGYSLPDADLYFRFLLYTTLSFNRNEPEIYLIDHAGGYDNISRRLRTIFSETYFSRHFHEQFGRTGIEQFINDRLRGDPGEYFR